VSGLTGGESGSCTFSGSGGTSGSFDSSLPWWTKGFATLNGVSRLDDGACFDEGLSSPAFGVSLMEI